MINLIFNAIYLENIQNDFYNQLIQKFYYKFIILILFN